MHYIKCAVIAFDLPYFLDESTIGFLSGEDYSCMTLTLRDEIPRKIFSKIDVIIDPVLFHC